MSVWDDCLGIMMSNVPVVLMFYGFPPDKVGILLAPLISYHNKIIQPSHEMFRCTTHAFKHQVFRVVELSVI